MEKLKFVLALGVKQFECAVVIGFRHKNLRWAAQITVVRRGGVNERLRGGDAVFVEHGDEHFGIDDRAGIKQFHAENLATDGHR